MSDEIAVLIPCFNEEKTIGKVVADFRRALPNAEIYVYDNNSTDNTIAIATASGATVRLEANRGKGNVIRSMFRHIMADCYIIVDGDDTYPAESAVVMADMVLREHVDMVIGDRLSSTYFTENKRIFHGFGNRLVRWFINNLFNSKVNDIMTGYRAFSYDFVKMTPITSKGFEVETEMTIHALDMRFSIREVLIQYRDRPEGSFSKLNTVKDGVNVLKTIFLLFREYRPFIFFTAFSVLFGALSLILIIPVLIEYYQTHLVPRFPTLFVSIFFAILSMLFFTCGLILDVVVKKNRQNSLIELNKITSERASQQAKRGDG
ncbi:MAG: glycosyltransferase family 2 protein [Oscillospiraceae bacterium]|nr:glycosyltransferase family 2 protein [Oscillospiraceae bacterium]